MLGRSLGGFRALPLYDIFIGFATPSNPDFPFISPFISFAFFGMAYLFLVMAPSFPFNVPFISLSFLFPLFLLHFPLMSPSIPVICLHLRSFPFIPPHCLSCPFVSPASPLHFLFFSPSFPVEFPIVFLAFALDVVSLPLTVPCM